MRKSQMVNRLNEIDQIIWNQDKNGNYCRSWDDFSAEIMGRRCYWNDLDEDELYEALERGEFITNKVLETTTK